MLKKQSKPIINKHYASPTTTEHKLSLQTKPLTSPFFLTIDA